MQQIESSQQKTFIQSFKDHPASVGETYFEHMRFAAKFSSLLFLAGGAALVHAIIPCWFESTAGNMVVKLSRLLESRH